MKKTTKIMRIVGGLGALAIVGTLVAKDAPIPKKQPEPDYTGAFGDWINKSGDGLSNMLEHPEEYSEFDNVRSVISDIETYQTKNPGKTYKDFQSETGFDLDSRLNSNGDMGRDDDNDRKKPSFKDYLASNPGLVTDDSEGWYKTNFIDAYLDTNNAFLELSLSDKVKVARVLSGKLNDNEKKFYKQFVDEAEWKVLNEDESISKASAIAFVNAYNCVSELEEKLDGLSGRISRQMIPH
jgi:hypothetical protein